MLPLAADQRTLRGRATTLSWQPVDGDGEPVSPVGTVTVGVVAADGTVIVPPATATTPPATSGGAFTYNLAAQSTLNLLVVTWTDNGIDVATTLVEVVGGYYFNTVDFRAWSGGDPKQYPTAVWLGARRIAEDTAEALTAIAWVPRYRRVRLDGSGNVSLLLPDRPLRLMRSARIYSNATQFMALTTDQLTSISGTVGANLVDEALIGAAVRTDFGVWTQGGQNVLVEYEYGYDRPPRDVQVAAMIHCRAVLNGASAPILSTVDRYTSADGTIMYRSIPTGSQLGIPEVDAAYQRYSLRSPGIA